jgi:hypothetical protein
MQKGIRAAECEFGIDKATRAALLALNVSPDRGDFRLKYSNHKTRSISKVYRWISQIGPRNPRKFDCAEKCAKRSTFSHPVRAATRGSTNETERIFGLHEHC